MAEEGEFSPKRCCGIFTEIIGRKHAVKYWKDIYLCLLAVDLGLKNSYLVDHCYLKPKQVETLITLLRSENFLSRDDLITLLIYGDIFVLQKENTSQYLTRVLTKQCVCFVDASGNLTEPQLLNCDPNFWASLNVFCLQFSDFIKGSKVDKQGDELMTRTFDFKDEILPPCTVFGLLLGYPVVYWMSNRSEINCLSEINLTVYSSSIAVQSWVGRNEDFVTVSSLSVPEKLSRFCEKYVKSWKDWFSENSQKQTTIVHRITCKQVKLPVVIL